MNRHEAYIKEHQIICEAGAYEVVMALDELHKRGYEQLRLLCGMSPNGSYWQWHIYPKCLMDGLPDMERNGNDYCCIQENHPYGSTGKGKSTTDVGELVEAMLTVYGQTLRLGLGVDAEYRSWYKLITEAVEQGALPVAYADGACAQKGWWLGSHIVPYPPFDRLGDCVLQADVAGIGWSDADDVDYMIKRGTELCMVREPHNPHDKNAIALYFANTKLGYVPKACNAQLAERFDQHFGSMFCARVTHRELVEPHFPKIGFAVYQIVTPVVLDLQ